MEPWTNGTLFVTYMSACPMSRQAKGSKLKFSHHCRLIFCLKHYYTFSSLACLVLLKAKKYTRFQYPYAYCLAQNNFAMNVCHFFRQMKSNPLYYSSDEDTADTSSQDEDLVVEGGSPPDSEISFPVAAAAKRISQERKRNSTIGI